MKEDCEMRVRRAGREDAELIRLMAEIAFPATYRDIITKEQIDYMMEWMYAPENIMKQMDEGHVYYIGYVGDVAAGYVSVQKEGEGLYHLHKIYVLPEFQGQGCGERLFGAALQHVREREAARCRVELNVNRNNKAVGFYRHQGMEVDRTGDFDIGNGFFMNDYIMRIDVER